MCETNREPVVSYYAAALATQRNTNTGCGAVWETILNHPVPEAPFGWLLASPMSVVLGNNTRVRNALIKQALGVLHSDTTIRGVAMAAYTSVLTQQHCVVRNVLAHPAAINTTISEQPAFGVVVSRAACADTTGVVE